MAKLSAKALAKCEASRNLGDELLAVAREIKAGNAARVHHIKVPEILEARMRAGLPQQKFADVLGVSTPYVPRVRAYANRVASRFSTHVKAATPRSTGRQSRRG